MKRHAHLSSVPAFAVLAALALLLGPPAQAVQPPDISATQDADRWRVLVGQDRPPVATQLVRDSANDRVVTLVPDVGAHAMRTWVRKGSDWLEIQTLQAPPYRETFALAYDAAREEVVLFGGTPCGSCEPLADTWIFDGADWQQQVGRISPPRSNGEMAYDRARAEVVLYTGDPDGTISQTWTWDGTSWTQKPTPVHPHEELHDFALAWDASRQSVVLHGGFTYVNETINYPFETWAWDGTQWTTVAYGPGLAFHGMASYRGHVVLFAGQAYDMLYIDTWILRADGWDRLVLQERPETSAFNELTPLGRKRVLLTGTNFSSSIAHWVFGPTSRS